MRKSVFFIIFLASIISCAKEEVEENFAKTQIVDWQGNEVGKEIPKWVDFAFADDEKAVSNELNLEGKKIFIVHSDGENLDFLQQNARNSCGEKILNALGRETATLHGLEKSASYWVKKQNGESEFYSFCAVFSIDAESFEKELKKSN